MNREWKPGDVVAGTVNGRPNVRLVAGWSKYDPQLRWCELSPRWAEGHDDECWFMPSQVADARPLVVIDPESREQVERLRDAMRFFGMPVEEWQAALRSLVTPPKPRCVAHGNEACVDCSRISSDYLSTDGDCTGCGAWAADGMHWDTCPGRIRGRVYANRDEAVQS